MKYDPIEKPQHYNQPGAVEPIDFIVSNSLDFLEGNVVKYIARYKHKNGLQDLLKAQEYMRRLVVREQRKALAAGGAD